MAPKRRRVGEDADVQVDDPLRRRGGDGDDGGEDGGDGGGSGAPAAAAAAHTARAAQAAEIARRRAAHFARFEDADTAEGDNVHVGGENARTLGPWSSAVELVNAREQAAAKRKGKLAQKQQQQQEAAAASAAALDWQPSRDVAAPRPPPDRVPLLFELATRLLVRHIDDVVSLWGVPDAIKTRLAAAVCAARALSPHAAKLFADHAPAEVDLPNCTQLDGEAMAALVTAAASARLEKLELGCCGRGFTDAAATALVAAAPNGGGSGSGGSFGALVSLRLQGAYNLSDGAVESLLGAMPALTALALPQGPRFDGGFVARLPALVPRLRELDLAECRGVPGAALAAALPQLMALRRLRLDGVPEVDDATLAAAARCPSLSALSIAMCGRVTDAGIETLANALPGLLELNVDDCASLTDASLSALAARCPSLSALSARRCVRVTDEGFAAVAARGALRRFAAAGAPGAGPATAAALARACAATLEEADLSFCRGVPEAALGLLADRCGRLRELRLYGCTQATDRFVNGHGNDELALRGLATSVRSAVYV